MKRSLFLLVALCSMIFASVLNAMQLYESPTNLYEIADSTSLLDILNLGDMPEELFEQIIFQLDIASMLQMAKTSHYFRKCLLKLLLCNFSL